MPKATLREKLRYRFENSLSHGPIAIIGWLALISFVVVVIAAIVLHFTGIGPAPDEKLSFAEAAWQSLMRALDSGAVGGDSGWVFRGIMLVVTIGGIFILSTLIGSISSGIDQSIEDLRKGKSMVLESNHTLILGYSSKIYSIISDLCIANENQKNPRIVILANQDKVEMEDDIRSKIPDTRNTKIIVRSGSPLEASDIQVVNPHEARSIIILSPEDIDNPDVHVIKAVLSLTNSKRRKKGQYHIVAEIKDPRNLEAAHLVGGEEAVYVLTSDLISRLTAQTCRQSGLSIVYTELLQFEGDEIYFSEEKMLWGKPYKDCLFAYEESCVIGVFTAGGQVLLNPKMDDVLQEGDKIIAISKDDDTIKLSEKTIAPAPESLLLKGTGSSAGVESTLILGWNKKGIRIIEELDNYVLPGSKVTLLADTEGIEADVNRFENLLKNIKVDLIQGDINNRATLEALNVETFDHIILLSYTENIEIQESDAKTLICLLHLRDLADKAGKDFSIVSEMLDIRNRELAEVSKADDFILSDKLLSLVLTQISENKALKKVYDILFESEGSEIYLKEVDQYVKTGIELDFYAVLESAARQGQTAIGYRIIQESQNEAKMYGVNLNPVKSQKIQFAKGDKIIVLGEV
ncbi:CASTOR/POLLUX-related putative ion channel [Haliscomenobacter hydrossis]|uniref:TrkA-N domain protein n=1 Tax=Haliscomenobacter hydrossis (strain ATCC 27775 / DSM 1100 / LMG 10767 / O) TaxID=760192 RepID=F4L3T0_HALH1|nr:NAD-binding protein [Haliscomenobacter hydrossis]AEE48684.1 TrkA-N domain protein [Haliscomenobacter hydrossis DSM 1100]